MENSTKGFIPVMLTPFSSNGSIDYAALTQLTEVYLQAGAAGLFANCLSSEMFELTDIERLLVAVFFCGIFCMFGDSIKHIHEKKNFIF